MAKTLFLHGWTSAPGGVKPTCLKSHGDEVINSKLDDDDFDAAAQTAQAEYDQHQPDVIVGSLRGAVAMNIESENTPSALIEVGNDHRLADPEPLAKMLEACERTKEQDA